MAVPVLTRYPLATSAARRRRRRIAAVVAVRREQSGRSGTGRRSRAVDDRRGSADHAG
ncbi:hypothetical protein [Kineococcus rhizosphaerae]|uniref:Uncharacterized protein n=1 Tax=Kineococcus rhizosphaerae TaxID=559628 RepID=A0A2T0R143_9ACTN|nr:hypothetical protein [Kineococcus rhizosphaerae]PRY13008.1 hypothetical protein CLV37_109197 [Kineococcus rhizosphaerae]